MKTRLSKTGRSFLFGLIGGASLALLLAPASGSETRSLIQRNVDSGAVTARQIGERVLRKSREALHTVATGLEKNTR